MNKLINVSYTEENLALQQHVHITVSKSQVTGSGSRDPRVLLNETAYRLHGRPLADFDQCRTYDTYDGQNQTTSPDWYAIEFSEPTTFNCLEMTMGIPYRDGGWWTSLAVEVRVDTGEQWRSVKDLHITPAYNFDDTHNERRPYETYALIFSEVTAHAVRVTGLSGGLAQFTSLARLAVYHRNLSYWNQMYLPRPPLPYIFQLIAPQTIWDLSDSLVKLTGLTITFSFMEYYLDKQRYQQLWRSVRRNYEGEPELWFLIADAMGWDAWSRVDVTTIEDYPVTLTKSSVLLSFHDTLASAVAPVVVDNQVLGQIDTQPVILKETFDWATHQRYAQEHGLPWPTYLAAIERTPQLTREQLEGAAALVGMIANTIANLAHCTLYLEHRLYGARQALKQRSEQHKELVRQAIDFMQRNLETSIDVAEVARAVALTPSYFCALFTEQTGRNPSDFLIDLRIERAKEYLAHTQMSVMDVCVALGYSPSYFSRLFKQRTNSTPSQYAQRKRCR